MALLRPRLAILDETDSGLDIDALKTVADGINSCKSNDNAFVLITHYQVCSSLHSLPGDAPTETPILPPNLASGTPRARASVRTGTHSRHATHSISQRLLEYVKPDYVHVMHEGRIVKTGGPELAHELEAEGYAFLGGRCGRDEVRAYDDA
jgi:Fe-S cluster assembly ATP-binding protein